MNDMNKKKILGEERRTFILESLLNANKPLSGSELSKKTHVSRQVIVQDISLLKARNEPIIATSQGYVYMKSQAMQPSFERVIACMHPPERVQEELTIIVDHGVTVEDVKVEHPIYGDLTALIMVSNRHEVEQYMKKVYATKASYLLQLTGGIHLHTIKADSVQKLDSVCLALEKANILLEE